MLCNHLATDWRGKFRYWPLLIASGQGWIIKKKIVASKIQSETEPKSNLDSTLRSEKASKEKSSEEENY
jgi:N-acetylmuramoyl-L-alanine amidase CwlA